MWHDTHVTHSYATCTWHVTYEWVVSDECAGGTQGSWLASIRTCIYTYMRTYVYLYVYVYMHVIRVICRRHTSITIGRYTYIYPYIHTYVYVFVNVYMYVICNVCRSHTSMMIGSGSSGTLKAFQHPSLQRWTSYGQRPSIPCFSSLLQSLGQARSFSPTWLSVSVSKCLLVSVSGLLVVC